MMANKIFNIGKKIIFYWRFFSRLRKLHKFVVNNTLFYGEYIYCRRRIIFVKRNKYIIVWVKNFILKEKLFKCVGDIYPPLENYLICFGEYFVIYEKIIIYWRFHEFIVIDRQGTSHHINTSHWVWTLHNVSISAASLKREGWHIPKKHQWF